MRVSALAAVPLLLFACKTMETPDEGFGGSAPPAGPAPGSAKPIPPKGREVEWDPDKGWVIMPLTAMPVRSAERPLTLAKKNFGIDAGLDLTRVERTVAVFGVRAAAGYGIDGDLEAGLELINWTFSSSKDSGLSAPHAYFMGRFLDTAVEMAGRVEVDIPVDGTIGFEVALPVRAHVLDLARIDLSPALRGRAKNSFVMSLRVPATLTFSVLDPLAIAGGFEVETRDITRNDVVGRVVGSVVYTIRDKRGAFCDLSFTLVSPDLLLSGKLPTPPFTGYDYAGSLGALFYIHDAPETERIDEW